MDDSENLTPGREEISSYNTFDSLVTSSARTNAIRSCRPISDDTNLTSFIFDRALDRRWSVPFLNPPDDIFEKVKLICDSYNVPAFAF